MFSYSYMSTYFPIFHDFSYPLQRPSYPRYHDYNCSALLCAFCLIFYELLYLYCFLSIYLITFYYLFLRPKSHFRKVNSTNSDLCKKCRTTHKSVDDVSWVWTCFTSFPTRVTRSHYFGNIIGQKIWPVRYFQHKCGPDPTFVHIHFIYLIYLRPKIQANFSFWGYFVPSSLYNEEVLYLLFLVLSHQSKLISTTYTYFHTYRYPLNSIIPILKREKLQDSHTKKEYFNSLLSSFLKSSVARYLSLSYVFYVDPKFWL